MNNRTKMIAFSLMLAVPATLSGCGNDYDDDCQYDQKGNAYNCDTHSSYYGGSSYSKKSSSHSGFGSGGVSGFFSGG